MSADAVGVAMGSPARIAGADEVARMFSGRAQAARRADLDGFAAAAWSVRRDGVDDEWVRTERDRRRGRLIEVLHELVAAAAWSVRGEVKVVFAFHGRGRSDPRDRTARRRPG